MPQSCSLQRQLDRYMATLPSVNPGALARASFLPRQTFVQDTAGWFAAPPANIRSILTRRQLCTAVSKPFISQKRLPVDLVFIYVSKYIAGSLLFYYTPLLSLSLSFSLSLSLSLLLSLSLSLSLFLLLVTPADRDSGFVCTLLEERSKSSTGTRDCVNFPPPG